MDSNKLIGLQDYFEEDFSEVEGQFQNRLKGKDVIVIGAAGSIGFATVPFILNCSPNRVLLLDQDENRLTTLLRLIRAKDLAVNTSNLSIAAMDFGSKEAYKLLAEYSHNPVVLNFAAAKHVRSERDKYGIEHLLSENFLKPWKLIETINPEYYFGVSTDKAANPVNFMGVSKALHEQLLFQTNSSSARFANVAFSQGSLLESWHYRLQWNEPLVAPKDIERFLITHEDAARLCAISIGAADSASVIVPNSGVVESLFLADVAEAFLKANDLEPVEFDNYVKAKKYLADRTWTGKSWPIVLTNSDTSGEKKYEEFVGLLEVPKHVTKKTSSLIPNRSTLAGLEAIKSYFERGSMMKSPNWREELISIITDVIPTFNPMFSDEILDNRP